jgi:hypothetical protein
MNGTTHRVAQKLSMLFGLAFCSTANASLLGTDWANTSNLYRIDPAAGVATLIGSTGQPHLLGLVVDTDSTIYTVTEQPDSGLWTLNPNTGAATLVGRAGMHLEEGDLTIDPVSRKMYVSDGIGDKLYVMDKATGAVSLVGSYGVDGRDVSGLQFFDGKLYGLELKGSTDFLVTIDTVTALATVVGPTGTNLRIVAAMGRDPSSGITYIGGPKTNFSNDNQLYSIDLTTGAATFARDLTGVSAGISGFSVAGNPVILNPTPEPGTVSTLGIALLSIAALRRKKPSPADH